MTNNTTNNLPNNLKNEQTTKEKIIYTLLTLVIIALIASSFIGIFQSNPQNSNLSKAEVLKKLSNIATQNNIEFSNKYLAQHIAKKHANISNKEIFEYTQLLQKAKVIQDIAQSIKIPTMQKIIHKQLDEIKNIITFNSHPISGNYHNIPNFIQFHKQTKEILQNYSPKNRQEAIKKIITLSKQYSHANNTNNINISHHYKQVAFFSAKDEKNNSDYELLTYAHGIISPIKQDPKSKTLSFSIIINTQPGYFSAHNIPHNIFHNVLLENIAKY